MEELLKKKNENMLLIISKDSMLMRCEVSMDQEVGVNNFIVSLLMHLLGIPIGLNK